MAEDIVHRSGLSTIPSPGGSRPSGWCWRSSPRLRPGVSQSAGAQATGTTVATSFQVSLCPTGHAGSAYLDGRAVSGEGDVDVSVTDDLVGGTTTAATNAAGLVNVDLYAGDYTFTLEVPGDFASFAYACFDGDGVFRFDGASNRIAGTFGTGAALSCRWYVIPDDAAANASVAFQVFAGPLDYDGDDYRTDCSPADPAAPVDVLLVDGPESDTERSPLTGTTGDQGRTAFDGLAAGTSSAALDLSERVDTFYAACFDATSGSEVFIDDGGGVQLTIDVPAGGRISCRWYVIPFTLDLPSPSPDPSQGTGSLDIQVFGCAVAYAGDDYRTDCTPTQPGTPVLFGSTVPLDEATASRTETLADGRFGFDGLPAGPFSVAVAIPGEFADVYHACFDVSTGAEVSLFDGDTNSRSFDLADAAAVSCRLYIIPEDLRRDTSASPSASASAAASARPSASSGPVATLPSTGTGVDADGGMGTSVLGLIALLAAAVIAAVVLVTRRVGLTR